MNPWPDNDPLPLLSEAPTVTLLDGSKIAVSIFPPGGIRWDFPAAPLEDDDAAEGL